MALFKKHTDDEAKVPQAGAGDATSANPVNPVTLHDADAVAGKATKGKRKRANADAANDGAGHPEGKQPRGLGRLRRKQTKRGMMRIQKLEDILAEEGMENLDP